MTPISARVLIDCDGGPVLCEVVALDELRGLARMRIILPGQKRDGLQFWRPWDALDAAPSVGPVNQPTAREDGDSPMRGDTGSAEAAGMGACRLPLCDVVDRTSRAGVPVAGARPVAVGAGR